MNRRQILAGAILTGGWGAAVWIAGGARAGWASEPPVAAPGPDGFIELRAGDATLKSAPHFAPRRRLDETLAARKPRLVWREDSA